MLNCVPSDISAKRVDVPLQAGDEKPALAGGASAYVWHKKNTSVELLLAALVPFAEQRLEMGMTYIGPTKWGEHPMLKTAGLSSLKEEKHRTFFRKRQCDSGKSPIRYGGNYGNF